MVECRTFRWYTQRNASINVLRRPGSTAVSAVLSVPQARRLWYRGRKGFSLTELLFAIFIMGTALAMSAALFPTAMRENKSSIDNVVGAIICKNAFTLARVTLQQRDITSNQVEIIADESDDHQDKLSLESQHFPFNVNEAHVAKVRGFVLLGRMLDVSKPEEGYQLVAVAYARNANPDDPGNNTVTVEEVKGDIEKVVDEELWKFVPETDDDRDLLLMGSPLILKDGTYATIVGHEGDAAVLDRELPTGDDIEVFVVIETDDTDVIQPFSPAIATMVTRTGLR